MITVRLRFACACLMLIGGCRGLGRPEQRTDAPAARIPTPMTLTVTQIAPGEVAGFRIVGGLASTSVNIMRGTPGLQTCPAILNGTCLDVGNANKVGAVTTDAAGTLLLSLAMPMTIPLGQDVAFQAVAIDGYGAAHVSNVVERSVVKPVNFAPPPATNVLLLLIDDVGADRLALYGAAIPATTPVIDSLAAEGVLFENAWALAWCGATRAALQTGRYGRRTGWGKNIAATTSTVELDPNLITLAELVEHSPFVTYDTSYVGKWHLASYASEYGTLAPIVQGWNWWSGSMANLDVWEGANPGGALGYYNWQKIDTTGAWTTETEYATTNTVDDALDRLAVMAEPWMIQVSFNASHDPFHVPPVHLHTDANLTDLSPDADKHRAALQAVDTEIGRLLDGITAEVRDRTTILLLGDNGTPAEVLKDEDPEWTESKGTLFDGGVRVPLIVTGPLVGVPGSTTEALASVVDVFPTIAEIAGVDTSVLRGALDPLQPVVLDGYSLLPVLNDPAARTGRTWLYAEVFGPGGGGPYRTDERAIRDARFKLMVDAVCGGESFFEYVAGQDDEGPNLLGFGAPPLTADQRQGLAALRTQLDEIALGLVYDAEGWPPRLFPPACGGDTGDTGAADTSDTANDTDPP